MFEIVVLPFLKMMSLSC